MRCAQRRRHPSKLLALHIRAQHCEQRHSCDAPNTDVIPANSTHPAALSTARGLTQLCVTHPCRRAVQEAGVARCGGASSRGAGQQQQQQRRRRRRRRLWRQRGQQQQWQRRQHVLLASCRGDRLMGSVAFGLAQPGGTWGSVGQPATCPVASLPMTPLRPPWTCLPPPPAAAAARTARQRGTSGSWSVNLVASALRKQRLCAGGEGWSPRCCCCSPMGQWCSAGAAPCASSTTGGHVECRPFLPLVPPPLARLDCGLASYVASGCCMRARSMRRRCGGPSHNWCTTT